MESGTRVGAILSKSETSLEFFGWGTYRGKAIPPVELWPQGTRQDRIELDSGKILWGFEAWWGPVERIKPIVERAERVTLVELEDVRRRKRSAWDEYSRSFGGIG
jgi:hypothetical protein